jgi:DNA-binding transcriptional ArsR family regulator
MINAFEAVAEPARRQLLDLLMLGPRPVGELVAGSGLSQPNTSRHLRILREAGLVEARADGQRRMYEVRPEGFAELARWLTPYVLLWQGGLDALEGHLEREEQDDAR